MPAEIRPFRPEDTPGVVATVREVFDEYGFTWEEDGYCADLYDVTTAYLQDGGAFWVAEEDGEIVATVGLVEHDRLPGDVGARIDHEGAGRAAGTDCELVRLYVRPQARGQALGRRLTETVMAEAAARGRTALELWSDKRLTHAHAMYRQFGAVTIGERICPGDPDLSVEWGMVIPLDAQS